MAKAHFRWLETQSFGHVAQQIVFQEYVDAVKEAGRLVQTLVGAMVQALEDWSLEPVVRALKALRGVDVVVAMTIMSELGDITRFDSPKQLMAYVGQVPSEHSSGRSRRQGGITKTGNGHVRRVLTRAGLVSSFPSSQDVTYSGKRNRRAPRCRRSLENTETTMQPLSASDKAWQTVG